MEGLDQYQRIKNADAAEERERIERSVIVGTCEIVIFRIIYGGNQSSCFFTQVRKYGWRYF